MNEHTFTWIIDRFSSNHLPTIPKQIRSPVFKADNLMETSWLLILTLESDGDCFACFLVRNDSSSEEIETVEIDFNMEIAVGGRKLDGKDQTVNAAFKKGDSILWGSFKLGSSAAKLLLICNMLECLPRKNPVSVGVAIHSKIGHLAWSPSCISHTTVFSGPQGIEFEVSLKDVNDTVSLKLSRVDNLKTISCFFTCRMFAHDKRNWTYSKETINMKDTFNYNQPFELPLDLSRNQITNDGIYFIDIYFHCSVLIAKMRFASQEKSNFMCRMIHPTKTDPATSSNTIDSLRNDLEMLYTKKIQADLKLKVETEVFHVHKNILSARSPVFRTMLDQNVEENQTGVINITDIDVKIFDMFLKYMYTGSCSQLDWESALNLLLAAENYRVYSLKKECADYLITTLSEDNVCDILNTADMVSDRNLKNCAMDYVKSHADEILLSGSWKRLVNNNPNLVAETLCQLSADFGTTAIEKKVKYGKKQCACDKYCDLEFPSNLPQNQEDSWELKYGQCWKCKLILKKEGLAVHEKRCTLGNFYQTRLYRFKRVSFQDDGKYKQHRILVGNKSKRSLVVILSNLLHSFYLHRTMYSMSSRNRDLSPQTNSMLSSNAVDVLRNDLEMMYINKIQTDMKLKIKTKFFPVHKCILSARSPVFRTMFEQDMVENQTGVVDITDVDAEILDMFLKYIYTGSCGQLDWESALNLMLVAEKYQVFSLKKDCSDYLITALSEDNVCEILNAADMVSDNNLKGSAMDYLKSHADIVLLSVSWKELIKKNSSLASETLSKLSSKFGATAAKMKKVTKSCECCPIKHQKGKLYCSPKSYNECFSKETYKSSLCTMNMTNKITMKKVVFKFSDYQANCFQLIQPRVLDHKGFSYLIL